jgi:PIN domain nuclease of toxin-antitoxin system
MEELDALGFKLLPLTRQHIVALELLPKIHKDPFDRMLVAQAITEQMPLVTVDAEIHKYSVQTI